MVSINKSFFYGIIFASITWIISLQLYIILIKNESNSTPLPQEEVKYPPKNNKNNYSLNNIKYDLKNWKANLDKKNKNKKFNSPNSDLAELGLVKTAEDQIIKDEGYKIHAYNVLISNQLSYDRLIPDTRNDLCKNVSIVSDLPKVSIVICFYNEHYHTLLRTLHSIVNRSLKILVEEIILIDDYSDLDDLRFDLVQYVNKTFPNVVKLFRTERREGLIRARIFGARKSKAEVLLFLDSHVEVNNGWLEPLLARIKENEKNVVMPVIDIINADTFVYTSSPLVRGGFNWGLHFKWENLPKGTLSKSEDFIKPIKSPTMAGGLFAINRKYFVELGEYDNGMNIWGGENLEISFRVWMCGGHLELIPCSRVGHVFRQRRPYGSPSGEDTMLYNSLRVAYVWMDNYKDYFLKQRSDAKLINFGDVSERIQLRQQLKCNNFEWYIRNIYPELALPDDNKERLRKKWDALEVDKFQPWHSRKRNYIDQFQIRLANSTLCVQSLKDIKTKGGRLVLKRCVRTKNQMFYQTDKNELVLGQMLCLQAQKRAPILYKCHEMGADQEWSHKGEENAPIYNIAAGMCLGAEDKQIDAFITMEICSSSRYISWNVVR